MVPASAPGFFCSNLVPSSEAVYIYIYNDCKTSILLYHVCLARRRHAPDRFFEPPRTRRRVLRFSCCPASIPLQCCVACPGLSDKASRPPSLAEWTADGNAWAPAHFCACPFFGFPLRARPAHRIRHPGCVPVQAQLLDQQGPGPNKITSKIFRTSPHYARCFLGFLLLPAAEERNRKAHAENGNTASAGSCGPQGTLVKMNRISSQVIAISKDHRRPGLPGNPLQCRPAPREGRGERTLSLSGSLKGGQHSVNFMSLPYIPCKQCMLVICGPRAARQEGQGAVSLGGQS